MTEREEVRSDAKFVNELINHRLTWFGTLQGLLFAALGFVWEKPSSTILTITICFLGASVAVSIGLSTYGANLVIESLEDKLDALETATRQESNSAVQPTPAWRNRLKWWWWLMPGYFVPWIFLVAWLAIVLMRCWTLPVASASSITPSVPRAPSPSSSAAISGGVGGSSLVDAAR